MATNLFCWMFKCKITIKKSVLVTNGYWWLLQLKSIQSTASDLSPFGNVPPVGADPDTDDEGTY